ncbi:MAG TPA: response regulator [Verrucomicrobiae bacterium]
MTVNLNIANPKRQLRPAKFLAHRLKKIWHPRPETVGEQPQNIHILLVEDHEPTRLALTQLLRHRHYRITTAASCSEARLNMTKFKDFQILISDIGLPDGTGHSLMIEFRKKFAGQGIALTGYGKEQDIAQSEAAGFTTHLIKPIRMESLDTALAVTSKDWHSRIFIKNGMPRNPA